jgi:hypothetical protein
VITKMVNLQKSNYFNSYYINYGYILNKIPLDNLMMHIYNRMSALDADERNRTMILFDLDYNLDDLERTKSLQALVQNNLIEKINSINSEEDILYFLKRKENLNDIPLVVKKYYNLK